MKEVTLQFPNLSAMIDFSISSQEHGYDLNLTNFILTGIIPQADIELALQAFSATLMRA